VNECEEAYEAERLLSGREPSAGASSLKAISPCFLCGAGLLHPGCRAEVLHPGCSSPVPQRNNVIPRRYHCASQPPSIVIGEPVIVSAASEHKKTLIAPTDSGVVNLSIGCFSRNNFSVSIARSVENS